MKNIFQKLLMIAIVGSFAFLYSCGEDEEVLPDAPTASASADATEYEEGSTATITLAFTAPGELSAINITPTIDGVEGSTSFNAPADFGLTDTETAGSVGIEVTVNYDAGSEVKLVFDVVDKENQTASDSVTFTVISSSPDARSYSAVLLESPLGDFTGQSFFATSTGTKYSPQEVTTTAESISPTIDFGFYYGNNDAASIASPQAYSTTIFSAQVAGWNTTNATNLGVTSLDAAAFAEVVTWEDIDEAVDAATNDANDIVSGLTGGEVISFVRVDGVKGLILVNELVDGNNDGDFFDSVDGISIEVLVQEDAE